MDAWEVIRKHVAPWLCLGLGLQYVIVPLFESPPQEPPSISGLTEKGPMSLFDAPTPTWAQKDLDSFDPPMYTGNFYKQEYTGYVGHEDRIFACDIDGDGHDDSICFTDWGFDGIDQDSDGYTINEGDCDDNDPGVNPDMIEVCDDALDNNCDGRTDEEDRDYCGYPDDQDWIVISMTVWCNQYSQTSIYCP